LQQATTSRDAWERIEKKFKTMAEAQRESLVSQIKAVEHKNGVAIALTIRVYQDLYSNLLNLCTDAAQVPSKAMANGWLIEIIGKASDWKPIADIMEVSALENELTATFTALEQKQRRMIDNGGWTSGMGLPVNKSSRQNGGAGGGGSAPAMIATDLTEETTEFTERELALISRGFTMGRGGRGGGRGRGGARVGGGIEGNCFNCGKAGHRASECRGACSGCGEKHAGYKGENCKKKKIGPGGAGGVQAGVAMASDDVQQMFAALAAFNKESEINKPSGSIYYNVLKTAAANLRALKMVKEKKKGEESKLWIDSGAGTTMLNNEHKNKFVDIHKSEGNVTVGNGATVEIEGVGTAKVNLKENEAPLQLNNSAYVPGLSFNLISVGNLTDDGYDVVFEKYRRGVTILKSSEKGKEIVAKGIADGKLYRLEEAGEGRTDIVKEEVSLIATTER
jgi:hypothetical protein